MISHRLIGWYNIDLFNLLIGHHRGWRLGLVLNLLIQLGKSKHDLILALQVLNDLLVEAFGGLIVFGTGRNELVEDTVKLEEEVNSTSLLGLCVI